MFGDESQNKLPLNNTMKIVIVDSDGQDNNLYNMIFDKMNNEILKKLKISNIMNIDDFYKNLTQNIEKEEFQGLLNLQWIEEISTLRPSVIIYYYHIQEGSTKEEEEIKISKIIDNIYLYDKYIFIYLFIFVPPQEFDIYQHLKDDEKSPNSIRKKLSKDFIYIFQSKEIWKTIELSKLCNNLIIYSRNYYKQLKEVIKSKQVNNSEDMIKYSIMKGVLSTIKSKKDQICVSKHLDDAYLIICSKSFNHKKYFYGNPDTPKLNFYEITAIADWLMFKIIKLNNKNNDDPNEKKKKQKKVMKQNNLDIKSKIDTFYKHITIFSSFDYGDKEKEGDTFYFYKFFWIYKRYNDFLEFFKSNINKLKEEEKYINKIGLINFYILYSFMKLIKYYKKYYKDIDLTKVTINDKIIPINSINILPNIYYGKPPQYYYKNTDTGERVVIGFNDEIYLKKLILDNDLTLDKMFCKLKKELIPNISLFYYNFSQLGKEIEISNIINDFMLLNKQNKPLEKEMKGLEIYLNMLRLKAYQEGIEESKFYEIPSINETMFDLYNNFEKSSIIKKFPKIYVNFLNKFTECLIYQMENSNDTETFNNIKKTLLFKSISFLAILKLLNEKEQDIFNKLLNDEEFIPVKEDNKTTIQDNNSTELPKEDNQINEVPNDIVSEQKEEKNENFGKNIEKNYIKKDDIVININSFNRLYNYENNSFSFNYNIKDIEKSQERKILDLVEYEFKISTKLEKLKLKFDNIKIFFICINEEINDIKGKNKKEIIVKEFTQEELSNCELSYEMPLILEHKIFLKYKKGKIYASKIMATLSQKKNIVYLFEIPNEFNKVIFIKNMSKNVLNFKYKTNYKIGKNQYVPFELNIEKEKIDDVEIKDLIIDFETIPNFLFKELTSMDLKEKALSETIQKEEMTSFKYENNSSNSLPFGAQRPSVKNKKEDNINENNNNNNKKLDDIEILKRSSCGPRDLRKLNKPFLKSNISIHQTDKNLNELNNNPYESHIQRKRENSITNKSKKPIEDNKAKILLPEFYMYNMTNNSFYKDSGKIQMHYHNFETLLNQGINKYKTLLRFLHEGPYKIKFSLVYYIRHKEIEDYIEYKEESLLEFNVVIPFLNASDIYGNNYQKKASQKEKIFLTNTKISTNFILMNKIEEDIQIKDIKYEIVQDKSIKYINSYLNDLIHLYDIDEEEKKEILLIKKNSNFNIPFEIEFTEAFKGSIGKVTIIWNTKQMEEYEDGKFNLLNADELEFPLIEVKPLEFEYNYKTEMNENKEILLDITIKNISNKSKQIIISIVNNEENYDQGFIIVGMPKQVYIIREKEVININYILIPTGRGELNYPFIKIAEKDSITLEKENYYFYFSEQIAII